MDTHLLPYISYIKTEISGTAKYVYLNDGSYFYCNKGDCIDFVFDVNGKKPPNQRGIYLFFYTALAILITLSPESAGFLHVHLH